MGLLTQLLITPVATAVLLALLPAQNERLIRGIALIGSALAMLFSWQLLAAFDKASPTLQFMEVVVWNSRLGTSYAVGIDGIALSMLLLATLLSFVALLASASIKKQVKGYDMLVLLLESAMLGVFMAQDWSLFYVFWELTLIPLFFLIDRWGGINRQGGCTQLRALYHGRLGLHAAQYPGTVRRRPRPLFRHGPDERGSQDPFRT